MTTDVMPVVPAEERTSWRLPTLALVPVAGLVWWVAGFLPWLTSVFNAVHRADPATMQHLQEVIRWIGAAGLVLALVVVGARPVGRIAAWFGRRPAGLDRRSDDDGGGLLRGVPATRHGSA